MRRRLDAELVRRGLVASRARAVEAIESGRVLVEGAPAATPARLVAPGDALQLQGPGPRFVSRGGDKLAGALAAFPVSARGCRALDAGASTGGFTDCLLAAGALRVYAVDVGRGQLDWSLRQDPRVVVLERTDIRLVTPEILGGRVELATADLAFISITRAMPALVACTAETADLVVLVKPQFEAGRAQVGRGGIVRDPEVHRRVLLGVRTRAAEHGLAMLDVIPSPIRGANGNIEFLAHLRKLGSAVADDRVDAVIARAHSESTAPAGARE